MWSLPKFLHLHDAKLGPVCKPMQTSQDILNTELHWPPLEQPPHQLWLDFYSSIILTCKYLTKVLSTLVLWDKVLLISLTLAQQDQQERCDVKCWHFPSYKGLDIQHQLIWKQFQSADMQVLHFSLQCWRLSCSFQGPNT